MPSAVRVQRQPVARPRNMVPSTVSRTAPSGMQGVWADATTVPGAGVGPTSATAAANAATDVGTTPAPAARPLGSAPLAAAAPPPAASAYDDFLSSMQGLL